MCGAGWCRHAASGFVCADDLSEGSSWMCVQRRVCVARVSRATASRTYFGPRTCLGPRTWNISICAVHTFERRSGSGGHESVGCVVGFVAQMRTAMEGAHAQQRQLRDVLVGDAAEAAATRQRVQRGVAAAGHKGQAMQTVVLHGMHAGDPPPATLLMALRSR